MMRLGMYYLTLKLKITALALELLWDLGNVLFCLLEWIRAMVILNVWEEVVCPIVTFLPAVISLNITRSLYATVTWLPYCLKDSPKFCVLQLSNLRMKGIQIIAEVCIWEAKLQLSLSNIDKRSTLVCCCCSYIQKHLKFLVDPYVGIHVTQGRCAFASFRYFYSQPAYTLSC